MKRIFRSQLDLRSLIQIFAIGNFGCGVLFMLIALLALSVDSNYEFDELKRAFLIPIQSTLFGVLAAIVSYPFYKFLCAKLGGHKIQGMFEEETDA